MRLGSHTLDRKSTRQLCVCLALYDLVIALLKSDTSRIRDTKKVQLTEIST